MCTLMFYFYCLLTFSQCGLNHMNEEVTSPELIESVSGIKMKRIDCGYCHSGSISVDGEVFLWGCNVYNACCVEDQENIGIPTNCSKYIRQASKKEEIIDFSLGHYTTLFLLR